MTDDFIQEMQEEQRRERLMGTARRFGLVAAIVVVIGLVGGGTWFWQRHVLEVAQQKASVRYFSALRLLGAQSDVQSKGGDASVKEAETILNDLAGKAPAGIKNYARMRLADLKKRSGDDKAALMLWSEVISDKKADSVLRDMARYLSLNTQSQDGKTSDSDVRKGYEALVQKGGSFAPLAREGLVALDLKAGNTADQRKEAKRLLAEIQSSEDSSESLRQRAGLLLRSLGDVK